MQTFKIGYTPTEKQAMFHKSVADETLFGGAAGGGKTAALAMEAVQRCMEVEGFQAYLFRRSYKELKDTLVLQCRRFLPNAIARFNASEMKLEFINGSCMNFRHCYYDSDRFQYAGVEIHGLFMDELTHFTKTVYDYLKTRLRAPKDLAIKPIVRCSANPGGIGHAWVKQRFIDGKEPYAVHKMEIYSKMLEKSQQKTIQFIPALATDNPHIGEDYIFELEDKPKSLKEALLYGRWDAFEGQVFDEWADVADYYDTGTFTHARKAFELPKHWKRYRAFDFGYTRPFAVLWFAVDGDGVAYLYREWYGASAPDVGIRMHAAEIAKGIVERERVAEEVDVIGYADPSIWDGSRGESIAEQMEKEGVYFAPGENARLAGKMQLHKRLAFDEEGRAGLSIFSTCKETIRTLPALQYDAIRPEDVDSDGEDHIYDALRYFLMARPVGVKLKTAQRRVFNPLQD